MELNNLTKKMFEKKLVEATAKFVEKEFEHGEGAHDWWHIYRVWQLARKIGSAEKADLLIVELAALLHDLDDWKLGGDGTPVKARKWLKKIVVEKSVLEKVCSAISSVSFKGAGVKTIPSTIEGKIVQDADRLDALGAMGIARVFAMGGSKGRLIWVPGQKPVLHSSFGKYSKSEGSSINHFYEKLLLLKERINTPTAKRIAQKRHAFMEKYLKEFFIEWSGKDL